MNVRKELKKGRAVRKKSWWWGRFIIIKSNSRYCFNDGSGLREDHVPSGYDDEWELYDHELHGPQHRDPIDAKYEDKYLKEVGTYEIIQMSYKRFSTKSRK